MSKTGLQEVYEYHHSKNRNPGQSVLKDERGKLIQKYVGIGKKVLDMGCRDGALTSYFAEGNDVLGIDIDEKSMKRAEEKLGIETKLVDINKDFSEVVGDGYDAVVAGEILEHLYYPEKVSKRVASVLKKGGVFVGSVPNAFNLKKRVYLFLGKKKNTPLSDPTHINHFTRQELIDTLEKYFEDVKIIPLGNYAGIDKYWPGMFSYDLFFVAKGVK